MDQLLESQDFGRPGHGRRTAFLAALTLLFAGCSQHQQHQKVIELDAKLAGRLGHAQRGEILDLMGEPTALDRIGDLEVWVYQYEVSGAKRSQKSEVTRVAPVHDELLLTFDQGGTLQRYQAVIEGRTTRRERSR